MKWIQRMIQISSQPILQYRYYYALRYRGPWNCQIRYRYRGNDAYIYAYNEHEHKHSYQILHRGHRFKWWIYHPSTNPKIVQEKTDLWSLVYDENALIGDMICKAWHLMLANGPSHCEELKYSWSLYMFLLPPPPAPTRLSPLVYQIQTYCGEIRTIYILPRMIVKKYKNRYKNTKKYLKKY